MHGGMATGGAHQAVYDAEHRPITAGGFVKNGPVVFEDIAKAAGLTSWHHISGTPDKPYIVEAKGPGRLFAGLRQRWVDGHLPGERLDAGCDEREDDGTACCAVPQQSRRHVYGCDGQGGRGERALGLWLRGGGLRQRWLAGHLRHELREESAVPQQSRRHVYGRWREGGRDAGDMVDGRDVWRLRRRRTAGFICGGVHCISILCIRRCRDRER